MSHSNHPSQAPEEPQPPDKPLSVALWNFSSAFFLAPQGTAIISILLERSYYQFNGLKILAKIVWIYSIVLLGVDLFLYLLRVILYPKHVRQQLRTDLIETSCLASCSIALTSITQFAILQYGARASIALYVLWWVEAGTAITACFGIPYVQLKLQPPGISKVSPATLLCFIAALTSAAMGGALCNYDHIGPRLRVPVIIVAYFEIGAGLTLAVVFDALILIQHFNQTHLQQERVWQEMMLCGPFGQGSFALQILGEVVRTGSFAAYDRGSFLTASAAVPIGYASQFMGLLTWGYGLFWWCFAVLSICHTLIAQPGGWRKTKFNISALSLVFPWGVFTNAASRFAKIMDSPAFAVVSTALMLILLVIWFILQIFTLKEIITGRIFGLEHGWKCRPSSHRSSESRTPDVSHCDMPRPILLQFDTGPAIES